MPNALFLNVPGHGHVNPSLPLVAELTRRGHHITYFVTEQYRARVEAAGAVFQPYATVHDDYFDAKGLSGSVPSQVAYELMTTAGEILPELLEFARANLPDYVLFDGMCPWGYFLARILDVPAVASLSLITFSPRALMSLNGLRALGTFIFRDMGKRMEANKRSQALGKEYGVKPLDQYSLLSALGDISFSYTSSYFQPFASTVPKSIRFVGWSVDDSPKNTSFSFEQVHGRRLVYVSLGTVNNDDPAFFRACIDAFTGADEFVMMTTGNRVSPESFGALPENISIYSWVPQIDLLKKAALFITHSGMGSVHDGLYFGTPLLLVPQQGEQMFTAMRVAELGAGLMLNKARISAETIRHSAERLLAEPQFKVEADKIGDTFRSAGGMTRAADEIEALLGRRHL